MNKEIWKDIKDYEGLYQVSNLGRIKTLKRITNIPNAQRIEKEKYLYLNKRKDGYYYCGLCKNGKIKLIPVHRLVAETFLNKTNFKYKKNENLSDITLKKLQVNHKDENKTNNRVENLEWCTRKYNCSYGSRGDRINKNRMIKIEQYDLNGNYINTFKSINQASRNINRNAASIRSCLIGKSKQCGGYIWKYEKCV